MEIENVSFPNVIQYRLKFKENIKTKTKKIVYLETD